MKVTPDTYRAAAERLFALTSDNFPGPFQLSANTLMATVWGAQLRGAAEALEHHIAVTPIDTDLKAEWERGDFYVEQADRLESAIRDALGRLREPTPGLDDLDRVLADLEVASRAYTAERDN